MDQTRRPDNGGRGSRGAALTLGPQPQRQPGRLWRVQLKNQQTQERLVDVPTGQKLVASVDAVGQRPRPAQKTSILPGGKSRFTRGGVQFIVKHFLKMVTHFSHEGSLDIVQSFHFRSIPSDGQFSDKRKVVLCSIFVGFIFSKKGNFGEKGFLQS